MAAIEACVQLGYTNRKTTDTELRISRKRLKKFKKFSRAIEFLSRPGPGLVDIVSDDTVVCRCEEVTMEDIQGRFCGQVINDLIWKLTGLPQERKVFTPRVPIKPVPFGVLAEE